MKISDPVSLSGRRIAELLGPAGLIEIGPSHYCFRGPGGFAAQALVSEMRLDGRVLAIHPATEIFLGGRWENLIVVLKKAMEPEKSKEVNGE